MPQKPASMFKSDCFNCSPYEVACREQERRYIKLSRPILYGNACRHEATAPISAVAHLKLTGG